MAKSILAQIKSAICNNSVHQWSEWILNDGICTSTRTCKRCSTEETKKTDHLWKEWILDDHTCSATRNCKHCGEEEIQKTDHLWGDWNIVENYCAQIRVCAHCRIEEKKDIEHDWGDTFLNNKCIEAKSCRRCYIVVEVSRIPKHTWGDWKYSEKHNCRIRKCEHCHELQRASCAKHNWTEWEFLSGKCIKESVCLNCGMKRNREMHHWGDWVRDFKCQRTQTRKCTVCGEKNTGECDYFVLDQHTWGNWQIKNCREFRECEICKEKDYSGKDQHTWGDWRIVNPICVEVRICKICGKYEYSDKKNPNKDVKLKHEYELVNQTCIDYRSEDDWSNTYSCEYKCKICGDVQVEQRSGYNVDDPY